MKGVQDFQVEKLDASGATVNGQILVSNPNGYKIKISSSDADLYLNDTYGGRTTLLEPVVIPANFDGSVSAKIRADFDSGSGQILPIVMSAVLRKSVKIDIKGTVKAKSFLFGRKIDFEVSEKASF